MSLQHDSAPPVPPAPPAPPVLPSPHPPPEKKLAGPVAPAPPHPPLGQDPNAMPLINVLGGAVRAAEGRWASAVAVMTALSGFGTGVWTLLQKSPGVAIAAAALLVVAILVLILQGVRRQRLAAAPQSGWFVGLRPLREPDIAAGRMIGKRREGAGRGAAEDKDNLDRLVDKLKLEGAQGLVLSGDRGCGKTSLLTAARLRLRDEYLCVMRDSGVNLTEKLRERLRSEIKDLDGSDLSPTASLAEALTALRARAKKPVLLILDQFEEIFTTWVHLAVPAALDKGERMLLWERLAAELAELRAMLLSAAAARKEAPVLCVLCVQRQFVGNAESFLLDGEHPEMSQLGGTLGAPAAERPHLERMYLEPPTIEQTRDLLLSATPPPWPPELVNRVLTELAGGSLEGADQQAASPGELQVIGQVLQTLRVNDARRYPGRPRLLQEYVARLARASADILPGEMSKLLAAFLPGSEDVALPVRTLSQLAQIVSAPERGVREALDALREKYALLERYTGSSPTGPVVCYRLLPSAAVPLLREALGHRAGVDERTDQLVSAALAQKLVRKRYVLPAADVFWLWRHPPLHRRAEIMPLVRRSALWYLGLWLGLGSLLVGSLMIVRFGLYRLDVEKQRQVVLKRGVPYLMPLLGSDDVAVATDFYLRDWMESDVFPSGRQLVEDVRNHRIYLQFLGWYVPRFDAHRDLNQRILRMADEYTEFRRNAPEYGGSREVDRQMLQWRLSIHTQPKQRTSACDEYVTRINESYLAMRTACDAAADKLTVDCIQARARFQTVGPVGSAILQSSDIKEFSCKSFDFIGKLEDRFRSLTIDPPFSPNFTADWNVLLLMTEKRERKVTLLLDRLTKVLAAKESVSAFSWEEGREILSLLSSLKSLTNYGKQDPFPITDAAQLLRDKLKGPLFEKLQDLALYVYAGGELPKSIGPTPGLRSTLDDGQNIDDVLVLLGPRDSRLLSLLEMQIKIPEETQPSPPPPEFEPPPAGEGPPAPPPRAVESGKPLDSALVSARKRSLERGLAAEKSVGRAVRVLFELQRHYIGGDNLIDSELIMRGLRHVIHRGGRSFMSSDGKLGAMPHDDSIDIALDVLKKTIDAERITSESWIKSTQDYYFRRELMDFADRFYQTRINIPIYRPEMERDRRNLQTLLQAMLRASVPLSTLLDSFLSRPIIQIERNDAEMLLLGILEAAVSDYEGQINIEGQPWLVRSRIRPLVERYIEQKDIESPRWMAIALWYSVTDANFEDVYNDIQTKSYIMSHAYALRRLLPNTVGFIQSNELRHADAEEKKPGPRRLRVRAQAPEEEIEAEQPLEACERLFAELLGRRATSYTPYREAVIEALGLLVRSPHNAEIRPWLVERIQSNLNDERTPYHLRRALWRIRQDMRE